MDHRRTGLLVFVEAPLIGRPSVSGGAFTGTAARGECAPAMAGPAGPRPVEWDVEPTWTGAALEVWNRTTLDLFLLDGAGRRVDVPACGHAATSALDIGDMIEVRAEEGYVFAFGAGDLGPGEERTTFVVIRAEEGDLNGAPPLELPACRGRPLVQEGV